MRSAPQDWIAAGIGLLEERGPDALTIENLCRALARTKGAFYHHFEDAGAFADALLAYWERENTERLIETAATGPSPRERLYEAVGASDVGLDRAIFAWALRDGRAQAVRRRVDARRIAFLAGLREGPRALRMAQLEYAAYLGALQIFDLPDRAGRRAWIDANELLLRAFDALEA